VNITPPEQAAFEAFQAIRAKRHPMMPATAWTHPAVDAARPDWKAAARAVADADPVHGAARHFAETWAELFTALPDDYGCEMNCAEANAAAGLYRALGDDSTAAAIISAHAEHDQDGDQHRKASPE
jgi:hypothetical protein